jgi:hypothetical protein
MHLAQRALLVLALGAGACEPVMVSNARVLEPKLVGTETVIDEQTGEVTTYSHWEYPDGGRWRTEDRFKKDTPVEARRATSRAPVRIVEGIP